MLYAHPSNVGTVTRMTEKKRLNSPISDDFWVHEGELVFKSLTGEEQPITESRFRSMVVVKEEKKNVKVNLDEMMNGYMEMANLNQEEDENYINELKELSKNKAF